MTVIISGDNGVSDVDGSAGTPAIRGTDANTGIFFPAADRVGVSTGGTQRVEVDASGNVGIACTPSAWGSTFKPIQFGLGGSIHGRTDTTAILLGQNTYRDSDGNYKYIETTAAGLYSIGTGIHTWSNAPSGTAGNNITFTERARLDSSGNLLVGTTSAMAEGVGIQVGEVGIDGVSGFGMTSAVSIADDATITLNANTGLLVFIEYYQDPVDGNVYPGAMFYCSYAGTVQLVSNSGGQFAAADTDGKACVFKSINTGTVTVKNRLGSTKSYSIHTLQLRGQ